jgi:GGDEF domain-containing protein
MTVVGATVRVTGSVGVVETNDGEHRDAAALLRQADRAMYAAKARNRRNVIFSKRNDPPGD